MASNPCSGCQSGAADRAGDSTPAAWRASLIPCSRSTAARLSFGTRAGFGPAPTGRWPRCDRRRGARVRRCGRPRSRRGGPTGSATRVAGRALRSTAGRSRSAFGAAILRVYMDAEHDPVDLAVVHRLDQLPLELGIALGLRDEQQVSVVASSVERAPDQVSGERRRRDRVGDEPDRVGRAGAQAARDDVRPVAGLATRLGSTRSSTSAEMRISSRLPESTNDAAV